MCRNLTEEAQGTPRSPLLVLAGMRQRLLGESVRLLQAAGPQLGLPQERLQHAWTSTLAMAPACAIAWVSSGTASATRPFRVYAAPKAHAIQGK